MSFPQRQALKFSKKGVLHEVIHIIHRVYIKLWGKPGAFSRQKYVLLKTHKLLKITRKMQKCIDKKVVRKFSFYIDKFTKNVIMKLYSLNNYQIIPICLIICDYNLVAKELGIMRFTITGKNIEVTEGLRSAVYEKIGKLDKYFDKDIEAIVTLSVERLKQKIEVTIPIKGSIIRAEQASSDMYVSIDLVEEIIERQLKKYKNKIIDSKQAAPEFSSFYVNNEYYEDEPEIRIVRSKKFGIKPMSAEEACIQMELLQHNFYVFFNSETEEVNVVYKRKNNTYGLIEPELD